MFYSRPAVRLVSYGSIITVLALGFTGCAQPLVTPKPPTLQSKVEHVADWETLAHQTSAQFATRHRVGTPVFVVPGPADMPFAAAFRNLLEKDLMDQGFRVHESSEICAKEGPQSCLEGSERPVVLTFDVQTFLYGSNNERLPISYATFWTTMYALGSQLRHVASLDTGVGIAAGAGPIIDVLASLYDTTKAEVLVTVSVTGDDLHYRDTDTFYVHPQELPFYWTHVPDFTPQVKPETLKTVSLSVTGPRP